MHLTKVEQMKECTVSLLYSSTQICHHSSELVHWNRIHLIFCMKCWICYANLIEKRSLCGVCAMCIQYMSGISFNSFLTANYSATAPTTTKNNYFILNIRILHIDFNNRLLFISVRLFDSVLINRFRLLALCYAVIWFFTHKTKTQFRLNFHINNFHYVSFLRMHFAVVFLNRMFLSVYGFFSIILLIYLFD